MIKLLLAGRDVSLESLLPNNKPIPLQLEAVWKAMIRFWWGESRCPSIGMRVAVSATSIAENSISLSNRSSRSIKTSSKRSMWNFTSK